MYVYTSIHVKKYLLLYIHIGNKLSYDERKEFNKLEKEIAKMGGQISEYEDKLATGVYVYKCVNKYVCIYV
jgi:uncharacterized tellurite resistance protein B-like protein